MKDSFVFSLSLIGVAYQLQALKLLSGSGDNCRGGVAQEEREQGYNCYGSESGKEPAASCLGMLADEDQEAEGQGRECNGGNGGKDFQPANPQTRAKKEQQEQSQVGTDYVGHTQFQLLEGIAFFVGSVGHGGILR